ncbi:MAG: DUF5131 family protein [Planctomycetia bacterium]|nr:DUF5131 family protein [Planctomycetia bacterium]
MSDEPLLGPLPNRDLVGIDWIIVGGESGSGATPMALEWVTTIRDHCVQASIPFFLNQWGALNKSRNGRELEGRSRDEMPAQHASNGEREP